MNEKTQKWINRLLICMLILMSLMLLLNILNGCHLRIEIDSREDLNANSVAMPKHNIFLKVRAFAIPWFSDVE